MKQICVVGVGYVGLVTGACFSDLGNRVIALDVNPERVENLKKVWKLSLNMEQDLRMQM